MARFTPLCFNPQDVHYPPNKLLITNNSNMKVLQFLRHPIIMTDSAASVLPPLLLLEQLTYPETPNPPSVTRFQL